MIEAHKAYLDPKNFDRLVDLSMVHMLQQSKGIIDLKQGSVQDALKQLGDTQSTLEANQEMDKEQAENPMAAFDENFAFGVDPKSTMRIEMKMLLMGLVDTQNYTAASVGLAGRRFVNIKDLTDKMNAVLAGVEPNYDAVIAKAWKSTRQHTLSSMLSLMH